jgi:hypothetical protein
MDQLVALIDELISRAAAEGLEASEAGEHFTAEGRSYGDGGLGRKHVRLRGGNVPPALPPPAPRRGEASRNEGSWSMGRGAGDADDDRGGCEVADRPAAARPPPQGAAGAQAAAPQRVSWRVRVATGEGPA